MEASRQMTYDSYPIWIVAVSNFVSIFVYFIGGFLMFQFGMPWLILYILYVLILELRLLKGHCVDCYYFGKTCAFGKGRLSGLFFKKGDQMRFCQKDITWKDILPDFLVSIIPAVVGVILLIINFQWLNLILLVILLFLGSFGSAVVRSQLSCKYCKQRELGCPAQKLFENR